MKYRQTRSLSSVFTYLMARAMQGRLVRTGMSLGGSGGGGGEGDLRESAPDGTILGGVLQS